MRDIKTLKDVEVQLRQHEDRLNRLIVPDVIDWHKKRIVNASPSVDMYDYVVRKELLEKTQPVTQTIEAIAAPAPTDYEEAVFGIAIDSELTTGNDLCPPHIVSFNGEIVELFAKVKSAAVGNSIKFAIWVHSQTNGTNSINNSDYEIPGSNLLVQYWNTFNWTSLLKRDYVTINVTQVGNFYGGSTLVVKMKYRKF